MMSAGTQWKPTLALSSYPRQPGLSKCGVAKFFQVKTNHRFLTEAFLTKVSTRVGSL